MKSLSPSQQRFLSRRIYDIEQLGRAGNVVSMWFTPAGMLIVKEHHAWLPRATTPYYEIDRRGKGWREIGNAGDYPQNSHPWSDDQARAAGWSIIWEAKS